MRSLIHSIAHAAPFNPQHTPEARAVRMRQVGVLLLSTVLLGAFFLAAIPASEAAGEPANAAALSSRFGRLPVYFVENVGQYDAGVAYTIHGRDQTVYFTQRGVTFSLFDRSTAGRWNLKLDFLDSNPDVEILGEGEHTAAFSYFRGARSEWKTGASARTGIVYRNLWPGIDLVYGGERDRLKYSFTVHPGADPGRIRLAWSGARSVEVAPSGELEISTPVRVFRDEAPVSYQSSGEGAQPVSSAYRIVENKKHLGSALTDTTYGFEIGDYDRTRDLIIDPAVLLYCGFIGGDGDEIGSDIAVDAGGNVYVVGNTSSTQATFPTAVGPDLTYNLGLQDAFIAKINAAGTALVYAGYIGGASSDHAQGVAVDGDGNAYVVGETFSNQDTFPVFIGPDIEYNGGQDGFITKINAAGTAIVYSGYIGGNRRDFATRVAVSPAGTAYVTGYTESTETTFPVLVGPDLTHNGGIDAFVARVNASGQALDYCGYIGGEGADYGRDIAIDSAGNAYIAGSTSSNHMSFPVSPPATFVDTVYNGGNDDAFVAKVNPTGEALVYCGYLGGAASDRAHSIAVDDTGAVYLAGETASNEATFPVLVGPDLTFNGAIDAFVAKLNPAGTALVFSGYIGGTGIDRAFGVAVDAQRAVYVAGETSSFQTSFPVLGGPQLQTNGVVDAFAAKINASGAALIYCGYLGGSGNDFALSIAVDADSNAIVVGYTESDQSTFPVTVGPDLAYNGGQTDAFVAKIERRPDVTPPVVAPVGAIERSQGASSNSTLAFVSDVDTLPGNIFVALRNLPPGSSISSLVNDNGVVSADIGASCTIAPGAYPFRVEAIDGAGLSASAGLTLNVTANTPPQLGSYRTLEIELLASAESTPTSAPSDNGTVSSITAEAPGFAGELSVDPVTGEVEISNASPAGVFTVTVTATDNCGLSVQRTFRLLIGAPSTTVNAASFAGGEASADSIASVFAAMGLATETAVAPGGEPLPTSLAGTSVTVVDSEGDERLSLLFFVSPGQINFAIPEGTASGEAAIVVRSGDGAVSVDRLEIVRVAPGIFTASSDGAGVAAAQVLRVAEDGTQTFEQVARFDEDLMQWAPIPIDFGDPGDTLFLVLYGTGYRFSGGFEATEIVVGETSIPVLFAGATTGFVGLDQINARLPRSLEGSGEVDVLVTIEGKAANTFRLAFR
ncbi:MAG: SBBP repeat-containing protein [Acidobacteria bacterium]|nr:SBBP repeat-containing protein [Acidobacteriota bacterium]